MTTRQRTARRPTGAGRPARQLKWANTNINSSLVSGSTPLLQQVNATLSAGQQDECTLVRTILCLTILPVAPSADQTNAQLTALGVGVTGRDAFGAGAGSVASPSVALEEPIMGWLYQCMYWLPETRGDVMEPLLIEKDMRTARKIGNGLPFIRFNNEPGAGTPFTVRIVGSVRTLYMLA